MLIQILKDLLSPALSVNNRALGHQTAPREEPSWGRGSFNLLASPLHLLGLAAEDDRDQALLLT